MFFDAWAAEAGGRRGLHPPPPPCCRIIIKLDYLIIWVIGVLRRTVVGHWLFDNLCGSHLQSQVVVLVSWKFKNPGERFDWSIDRVSVGKRVLWLAVETRAETGYANRWVARWIINNVLLFLVWVIVCKVRKEVDSDLGQYVLSY